MDLTRIARVGFSAVVYGRGHQGDTENFDRPDCPLAIGMQSGFFRTFDDCVRFAA